VQGRRHLLAASDEHEQREGDHAVIRAAVKKQGAPEDLMLCLDKPSIPLAQELMSICDLTIATGGSAMVKAAYSSGKPAYGVGAGNATVVVDETADIAEAAMNTRISKTQNHGSGCSCDGNLLVEASVYDAFLEALQKEGGYLATDEEKRRLEAVMWDAEGRRTMDTIARAACVIAQKAGFTLPAGKSFIIVKEDRIGKEHRFSGEKLSPVLAIFSYSGFDNLLRMVSEIFEVGGKGHSVGIASYDDDHIHRLALAAPVSRIMVRQPNVRGNAGSFTNGMPQTASLGCGTWGGNITSEKHQRQALHEHDVGKSSHPRRQTQRAGTARRVLQLRDLLRSSGFGLRPSGRSTLVSGSGLLAFSPTP
jgi:sulfoacetaldehyde dehydrogenase